MLFVHTFQQIVKKKCHLNTILYSESDSCIFLFTYPEVYEMLTMLVLNEWLPLWVLFAISLGRKRIVCEVSSTQDI